ncbi:carbohydrate sulfotransferase 6 [Nelusetta ayraudi]|uniref:carbohydrate sulfotransferase 6 n=1 Tax=Nelusetta ayraudi TaxID=303726 RepID=UPI003F71C0CE
MFRCRANIGTLILLFALQGATVVFLSGWYYQITPCASGPPASKVHVLLLSSWRSGSSFLGQVFSQHPSVFYLMEPGWHVWSKLHSVQLRMLRAHVRDLFHGLLRCDFSGLEAYLSETHNVSNVFMWSHSRALCSPPACGLTPRGLLSNQSECDRRCDAIGLQGAHNACALHSHVVLKAVRFFELESLYPLLRDPALDVRIVHLVRDPRAVTRSREQSSNSLTADSEILLEHRSVPAAEVQVQAMQEICRSHVRINERAVRKPPPFLAGRYKMVRFEDMVRDPLGEVNAIYRFAGLQMTTRLADWIYRVTHGKGTGSRKEAFYITSRDAKDVSQAWRTALPFSTVRRVQDVCKGAMSLLGYRTVSSEAEQKRLDLDLLLPLQPYKFTWLPAQKDAPDQNKTARN